MLDIQPTFIRNDSELFELAQSIDPQILSYFRLLEHPYRGGPDFRYLFTTDQVQEVLIQSVQLSTSRTGPFTITGPYGTGKSTIITRMHALFDSQEQYKVVNITAHRGVTKNWLIRKIAEGFGATTARSYSQTLENVQGHLSENIDQSTITPILIIDDGHFLDNESLSTLYSLLNAEDNKVKFVQLIIAGQEPLLEKIALMGELDSRMRSIEIAPMTPDELKKMFQFRWQVAGGKTEDFPFEETDLESFTLLFRYSKGLPRNAILVGDELLKHLLGKGERKAKPADVDEVAKKTLVKGRYKTQEAAH
jgi:general secretion pathway protein A